MKVYLHLYVDLKNLVNAQQGKKFFGYTKEQLKKANVGQVFHISVDLSTVAISRDDYLFRVTPLK